MSKGQVGAEQRLVTPGMTIGSSSGKRAGVGIIIRDQQLISTQLGFIRESNNVVSISPIRSHYMPQSGDLILGLVAEVRNNMWFLDINGTFQALLPMSLAPWKVEFGATRRHLDVGDVALARVQEVDETHSVVLTMKGVGLRKLKEGSMVTFPVQYLDQLREGERSILSRLQSDTDCRIILGENGRVWLDGDATSVSNARRFFDSLKSEGHRQSIEELYTNYMN